MGVYSNCKNVMKIISDQLFRFWIRSIYISAILIGLVIFPIHGNIVMAEANSENSTTINTITTNGLIKYYGVALKSISTYAGFFTQDDEGDQIFYGTTRSGEYCRFFRYNITNNIVDWVVPIQEAKGAWTILQDGYYLYIGTYQPASLYQYNLLTMNLKKIGDLGNEEYIWDMKQQGRILYIGTYPSASVFSFNMDTGALENLGRLSHENYVRSLEIVDNKIYTGIGAKAELIEFNIETKTGTNILPPQYADNSFVFNITRVGNMLMIGLSPSGIIL